MILGGGTAGWMCAAGLSRMLDMRNVSVTVVESEEIGTVGVGEATIPTIQTFNSLLGIDEADFMRATKATIKLGIKFDEWGALGDSYIHPFGIFGVDRPEVRFHQMWLKLLHDGANAGDIGDYNMSLVAARMNRFGNPDPGSRLPFMGYAYHFDASLYGRYLRQYAELRGVIRQEGRVNRVEQREDGFVTALTLEDGRAIDGDLFVDCSGFRGLLIAQTLGVGFEDWTHWLPCDRAVARPCESPETLVPYTRSMADSAGWRWQIPLQHRVGNGYVYSSAHISDDEAASRLAETLPGKPLADPLLIRFRAGRRHKSWDKNVVAVGLAGGFIEPLESTSIHLIQTAISRLILLFPDSAFEPALAAEFNQSSQLEYEQVRDFIILHYKATERSDTDFWARCRDMAVPESLAHKMELFRCGGRIFRFRDDLFTEHSWLAVMLGQGIVPKGHDPVADSLPTKDIEKAFHSLREAIRASAERLPEHAEFIRSYCKG